MQSAFTRPGGIRPRGEVVTTTTLADPVTSPCGIESNSVSAPRNSSRFYCLEEVGVGILEIVVILVLLLILGGVIAGIGLLIYFVIAKNRHN